MLEIHKLLHAKSARRESKNGEKNKLFHVDRQFHDWYRFVLSFPPQLVRHYIRQFNLGPDDVLLDPFCGTGTTLLESKFANIPSIGIEANSFAHFASSTKIDWSMDSRALWTIAKKIQHATLDDFANQGISDRPSEERHTVFLKTLTAEQEKLVLKDSISPLPLHKALVLLEHIKRYESTSYYKYLAVAFANSLVYKISNLKFGPEVGVGKLKFDVPVVETWFEEISKICSDLAFVKGYSSAEAEVNHSDSRNLSDLVRKRSISAVITSPPYPNEKDYTRTTRLETVLLGLVNSRDELRTLKKTLLRSNTRGVYKGDDDDEYVKDIVEVQRLADEIEKRRIQLGKTSGFERMYAKVTKLYFGGIAKHLRELQSVLRPNARLAYVVGDQASYLRVMIRTGTIIGDIGKSLGYDLEGIDLFRTRFSTATKTDLNEEVVLLRWPG